MGELMTRNTRDTLWHQFRAMARYLYIGTASYFWRCCYLLFGTRKPLVQANTQPERSESARYGCATASAYVVLEFILALNPVGFNYLFGALDRRRAERVTLVAQALNLHQEIQALLYIIESEATPNGYASIRSLSGA